MQARHSRFPIERVGRSLANFHHGDVGELHPSWYRIVPQKLPNNLLSISIAGRWQANPSFMSEIAPLSHMRARYVPKAPNLLAEVVESI